jgi:hypothetical protein
LAVGAERSPLLDTTDGTLTDEQLVSLEIEPADLPLWLEELERHDVFFSEPLDLDLLMLEAFTAVYQSLAVQGPRLPKKGTAEYDKRLASATRVVLGDSGGDGSTYSPDRQALFPWYSYLFLGRGKPSTHVLALTKLTDAQIQRALPPVLARLRTRVAAAIA